MKSELPTSMCTSFTIAFVVSASSIGSYRLPWSVSPRRCPSPAAFARRRTTCLFSDGTSNDSSYSPGEQALSKLRSLRDALDSAVEREDYAAAARLRDAISQLEKETAASESGDKFDRGNGKLASNSSMIGFWSGSPITTRFASKRCKSVKSEYLTN